MWMTHSSFLIQKNQRLEAETNWDINILRTGHREMIMRGIRVTETKITQIMNTLIVTILESSKAVKMKIDSILISRTNPNISQITIIKAFMIEIINMKAKNMKTIDMKIISIQPSMDQINKVNIIQVENKHSLANKNTEDKRTTKLITKIKQNMAQFTKKIDTWSKEMQLDTNININIISQNQISIPVGGSPDNIKESIQIKTKKVHPTTISKP